jgi:hypothetical protein
MGDTGLEHLPGAYTPKESDTLFDDIRQLFVDETAWL